MQKIYLIFVTISIVSVHNLKIFVYFYIIFHSQENIRIIQSLNDVGIFSESNWWLIGGQQGFLKYIQNQATVCVKAANIFIAISPKILVGFMQILTIFDEQIQSIDNNFIFYLQKMCIFSLQFSVRFNTTLGQNVYICGNIQELGNWKPQKSLKLYTDQSLYPVWKSYKSIKVKQSTKLEFKICMLDCSGRLIKWENLPANKNRILVVNCSREVTFSENNDLVQSRPIFSTPIPFNKTNAYDIFNGRYMDMESLEDSDTSSGKDFWNQVKRVNEDNSSHYLNFISSMQRNVECQNEHQIQFCLKDISLTNSTTFQLQPNITQKIFNFYLKLKSEEIMQQQCPQDLSESTNQDFQELEKVHQTKPMRDELIFYKDALKAKLESLSFNEKLVVHILLCCQKKKLIRQLLLLKSNWKVVLHIPKTMIEQALVLLQYGANMFIFENQDTLKQFINICKKNKCFVKMLKISLFAVELLHYRNTLLHCINTNNEKVLQHLERYIDRQAQQKIQKINKSLGYVVHYTINDMYFQKHANLSKLANSDKPSKKFIMLLVENLKDLNIKTIRYLIGLSDKKNHEVYIFQKQPLSDIDKLLPSSVKNKILVLSSDGQVYCSRQRHVNIYEKLSVPIDKIVQQLDRIAQSLQDQTRCKIVKKYVSLQINFEMDQISQYIRKYIIQQVRIINAKTIHKLTITQNNLTHKITIKPYCVSSKFFFKTIIRDFMQISLQSIKNTLFFVDFSSDDKIMSFIQKQLKNYQENTFDYYGFYCRFGSHFESNYTKPVINQSMLVELLNKLHYSSSNQVSQKSSKNNLHYKHCYDDFYQIHTP